MTKRREPLTYHSTLTVVAARIGWDRCGAICGVGERAVRLWSDPDCETEIRMIDAERLDRAYIASGGDFAPFHRLFALRLEMAVRADNADLVKLAGDASRESGEAIGAFLEFSADPDCPEKRRRALKEIHEGIDRLTDCAAQLGSDDA